MAINTNIAEMAIAFVSTADEAYAIHCWIILCMTQRRLEPTHLYDSPFPATVLIAMLIETAPRGPSAACWAAQISLYQFLILTLIRSTIFFDGVFCARPPASNDYQYLSGHFHDV